MFENLGWGEIAVLLVLALFVFGPERLPGMAANAGRWLRKLLSHTVAMLLCRKAGLPPLAFAQLVAR